MTETEISTICSNVDYSKQFYVKIIKSLRCEQDRNPGEAQSETVSVLAPEGVCRSLQVIPTFVRVCECVLCLDETSCVCVCLFGWS